LTCADIQVGANLRVEVPSANAIACCLPSWSSCRRRARCSPVPARDPNGCAVSCTPFPVGAARSRSISAAPTRARTVRLTDQTQFQARRSIRALAIAAPHCCRASIAVTVDDLAGTSGQVRADVVFLQQAAVPVDLLGTIDRVARRRRSYTSTTTPAGGARRRHCGHRDSLRRRRALSLRRSRACGQRR
jgi:hypothetical protein